VTKLNKAKKNPFVPLCFLILGSFGLIAFTNSFYESEDNFFAKLNIYFHRIFQSDEHKYTKLNNINEASRKNNPNSTDHINAGESKELYYLIEQDFYSLKKTLNTEAYHVSEIIWNIHDQSLNMQNLSSSLGIKISNLKTIKNYLEIDVFSNEENKKVTTVIQLSYFDKNTKNKIFEITRSYEHKKKPD
jgi:hypothetical protein